MVFNSGAFLPNGAYASNVLGQPNFLSNVPNNGGVSASSLNGPLHPTFDGASGDLFVGDLLNNRVLRYRVGVPETILGGRVIGVDGRGIRGAALTLTDLAGNSRIVFSNPFGHYRFHGVVLGTSYTVSVVAKRYQFIEPKRVILVEHDVIDLNFYTTGSIK